MSTELIIKGWHVMAITTKGGKPTKVSRIYHVKEAAEQYAELMKKSSKWPGSVTVRVVEEYAEPL